MNNIVIGIVANPMDVDNKSYECIVRNNLKYLDNKCSYIGIIQFDKNGIKDSNVLDCCDGIIFQGGNYIYPSFYDILDYAVHKNIPVLGICMGMQLMGLYANKQVEDDLIKVDKHNNTNHIINKFKKYKNIKILSKIISCINNNILVFNCNKISPKIVCINIC